MTSLSPSVPNDSREPRSVLRHVDLCQPLQKRIGNGRDQAAFVLLRREMSLAPLNDCLRRIPDQEITTRVVDQLFLMGSLLASEAYRGIEQIRAELKTVSDQASNAEARKIRRMYDEEVLSLGRFMFALGRRLHQVEKEMAACPFPEVGADLRAQFGRTIRQQSGDVAFLRQELHRWVHRFVPLQHDLVLDDQGLEFIKGRVSAVVDELGLRLDEIREVLFSTMFQQLSLFDPSLTRPRLFRRELDNVSNVEDLLEQTGLLFDQLQLYDETRDADALMNLQVSLRDFDLERFPALSGIRDSERILLSQTMEAFQSHQPLASKRSGDDPLKVLMLLFGDLIRNLKRSQLAS